MSIASEITRLQGAKSALKTAINAKTDAQHQITNETIEDYASFVNSISGGSPNLQSKSITITTNTTTNVSADSGYDGLSSVAVTTNVAGTQARQYLVQVIDYDGTVLKSEELEEGETFTLPSNPSHTGLTFQSWSSPVTITNSTITVGKSDITIGATYTTASGYSELDIELTPITGLTISCYITGTKNWGDGNTNTDSSHTYANYGKYTIVCQGTSMSTSSSRSLFGKGSSTYDYCCVAARITGIATIGQYAFRNCRSLKNVTISTNTTSVGGYAFSGCCSLESIVIPSSADFSGDYNFLSCFSLKSIAIPYGVTRLGTGMFSSCRSLASITIPASVNTLSPNAFDSCFSLKSIRISCAATEIDHDLFRNCSGLKYVTITGLTSIGANAFLYCYSLTSITIPNTVTSIGNYAFNNCRALKSITIPSSVTSIGTSCFAGCDVLEEYIDNSSITQLSKQMFSACYSLTSITVPSSVTSVGAGVFNNDYSILIYDFSSAESVPSLANTNAFTGINDICKIVVPDSLYATWVATSNWVTYADYIYKASEVA